MVQYRVYLMFDKVKKEKKKDKVPRAHKIAPVKIL